jgi:glycosyltransferase involved in cell wall biosynthesis
MKICFVLPKIIPATNGAFAGGVTNCVVGAALSLYRNGYSIDLMSTIDKNSIPKLKPHPVFSFFKSVTVKDKSMLQRGISAINSLKKEIIKQNNITPYDIIHIHSGSYIYALTINKKELPNAKILHSLYCPVVAQGQTFLQRLIAQNIACKITSRIDNFIGVSKNICRSMRDANFQTHKINYYPMCVDIDKFNDQPSAIRKNRYFKSGDEYVRLLFIGNTSKDKGLNELVQSLILLKKEGFLFELIATVENQSSRSELIKRHEMIKREIKRNGLEDIIKFVGVIENIQSLIKSSDIILFPFQNYTGIKGVSDYPMAILESMACGKCVVSTPFGGVIEVLKNRENGMISNSFSPNSFAESLIELIRNESLQKKISINARNTIINNFSTEIITQKLIRHYQNLLSK